MSKKSGNDGGDKADSLRAAISAELATELQAQAVHDLDATQALPGGASALLKSASEAWAPGEIEKSPVASRESLGADIANPSGAFLASKLDQDANLLMMQHHQTGDPSYRLMAEQVTRESRQLARSHRVAEPTKVKIGHKIVAIPASVNIAPCELHERKPDLAEKLFHTFCKGKTEMIMRNASKGGHSLMPFLWLTQALWNLLDHQEFRLNGKALTRSGKPLPEFDNRDAQPGDAVRIALEAWAGEELALLILTRCHDADISLMSGLRQCFRKLDDNRQADIDRCQKHQTARQWINEDEDDDDE